MSESLSMPAKPAPQPSAADKNAFARVEKWMEMIREISRLEPKPH